MNNKRKKQRFYRFQVQCGKNCYNIDVKIENDWENGMFEKIAIVSEVLMAENFL